MKIKSKTFPSNARHLNFVIVSYIEDLQSADLSVLQKEHQQVCYLCYFIIHDVQRCSFLICGTSTLIVTKCLDFFHKYIYKEHILLL